MPRLKVQQIAKGIFLKANSRTYWLRYADATGKIVRVKTHTEDFDAAYRTLKVIRAEIDLLKLTAKEPSAAKLKPETKPERPLNVFDVIETGINYSRRNKRSSKADEAYANNMCVLDKASGKRQACAWCDDERAADSITGLEFETKIDELGDERDWSNASKRHMKSFIQMSYREAGLAPRKWTAKRWTLDNSITPECGFYRLKRILGSQRPYLSITLHS